MAVASQSEVAPFLFRDEVYACAAARGKPVPWDVGEHQPALERVAPLFQGRVLDLGCGTGHNALWLGTLPGVTAVTAVDASPLAVERCRAHPPHPKVAFLLADAFALPADCSAFDTVLDSALYSSICGSPLLPAYLATLTRRVRLGGTAVLLTYSTANPEPFMGPPRVAPSEARAAWEAAGWRVDSLLEDAFFKDALPRADRRGGHALLLTATRVR